MQIGAKYSHLNGEEYLLVHHQDIWSEVQEIISEVDAISCKTKVSREKTIPGKMLYSPYRNEQSVSRRIPNCRMERAKKIILDDRRWKVAS